MHYLVLNLLGLSLVAFLFVVAMCCVVLAGVAVDYMRWLREGDGYDDQPQQPSPEPIDPSDNWKHPRLSGRN